MAKTTPVEVRVRDVEEVKSLLADLHVLLTVMSKHAGDLPAEVVAAATRVAPHFYRLWEDDHDGRTH